MSTLKTLLVHVDSSPRAAVRLKLAEQLALAHGAQATAAYAVTSALMRYPMAMASGADIAPMLAEVDAQRLEAARTLYAASVTRAHVDWLELGGPPIADFTQQALYADLLVLGQRGADEARDVDVPADFVSSVLIGSGRPAIVVPHIVTGAVRLGRVMIAWKPTRESARAVTAALPLLLQAAQVTVGELRRRRRGRRRRGRHRRLPAPARRAGRASSGKSPRRSTSATSCCHSPPTSRPTCW